MQSLASWSHSPVQGWVSMAAGWKSMCLPATCPPPIKLCTHQYLIPDYLAAFPPTLPALWMLQVLFTVCCFFIVTALSCLAIGMDIFWLGRWYLHDYIPPSGVSLEGSWGEPNSVACPTQGLSVGLSPPGGTKVTQQPALTHFLGFATPLFRTQQMGWDKEFIGWQVGHLM